MLCVHTYTEFVGCKNIEHSGPVDRYPHVVCISISYDCTSVHQIGPLFAGHRFPYRGLCNLRLHAPRFSGLWLRVWKKEKWEQEQMIWNGWVWFDWFNIVQHGWIWIGTRHEEIGCSKIWFDMVFHQRFNETFNRLCFNHGQKPWAKNWSVFGTQVLTLNIRIPDIAVVCFLEKIAPWKISWLVTPWFLIDVPAQGLRSSLVGTVMDTIVGWLVVWNIFYFPIYWE